jgi:hypothetical protein
MNVTTDHANGIAIVRVGESRLMYPLLSEFASVVTQLLGSGERKVIVDLSSVGYVRQRDHRLPDGPVPQAARPGVPEAGGRQKARRTIVDDAGAQNFHRGTPRMSPSAVKSFGA